MGHEATHEVSRTGRVRGLERSDRLGRRVSARELRPYRNGRRGVPGIQLHTSEGSRFLYLHVMLAEAFIGPPPFSGAIVRHLNDDTGDIRIENLAYGSHSDNNRDAVRNGVHYQASKTHCPRGHELSGGNLYGGAWGRRQCASCAKARTALRCKPICSLDELADAYYLRCLAGDEKRMSAEAVLSAYGGIK